MVVRSKGPRSKTRHKLMKSARERGNPPVTHTLRTFEPGSQVAIVINPAIQKGQPHPRFHGLTGTVVEKQGDAFVVEVTVGKKVKQLVSRPEHLKA